MFSRPTLQPCPEVLIGTALDVIGHLVVLWRNFLHCLFEGDYDARPLFTAFS